MLRTNSVFAQGLRKLGRGIACAVVATVFVAGPANADVSLLAHYSFSNGLVGQEVSTPAFNVPAGSNRAIVVSFGVRHANLDVNTGYASWIRLNNDAAQEFNILAQESRESLHQLQWFSLTKGVLYLDDNEAPGNRFIQIRLNGGVSEQKPVQVWVFGNVDSSYTPIITTNTGNPGDPPTLNAGNLPASNNQGFFAVDSFVYRQHTANITGSTPAGKTITEALVGDKAIQLRGGWIMNPPASAYQYSFPNGGRSCIGTVQFGVCLGAWENNTQFAAAATLFRTAYRVDVNAGPGGTAGVGSAAGPNVGNFNYNGSVLVVAQPDPGYRFAGWSGPVSNASEASTFTSASTAPITVTANFQKIWTLNTSVNVGLRGSVAPAGTNAYDEGESVLVEATPNFGYVFTEWTGDTQGNVNDPQMTVTMDQDRALQAVFDLDVFTVTFNLDGRATRSGGGDLVQQVPFQSSAVAPTLDVDPQWLFSSWSQSFSSVTADLTVTAQYIPNDFEVTFDLDGKGIRTGGGQLSQTIVWGNAATAPIVQADPEWVFTGWDVAFDNITADLTVTAQYDVATFTVTFDLDGRGVRTGGGDLVQVLDYGDDAVAPTVDGSPAWIFTGWDVAFTNVTSDFTVTAQYDPVTFTVTLDLDGRATRTGGGDLVQTVNYGDDTIPPVLDVDPAWVFTGWDEDITNVTDDINATAQYDVATFTVSFDLDGKATRTGGGDLVQVVDYGNDATAPEFDVNPGWLFTGWDAAFTNVTGDITVTAQFDSIPPAAESIVPTTTGPTAATSVDFTVTFNKDVVNFTSEAELEIVHTGTSNTSATISGGPMVYTVTVDGIAGDGSFTLAVSTAGTVESLLGEPLDSSVTSDPVVIDNTAPVFSGLVVTPEQAEEGDTVTIAFDSDEAIAGNPDVTVNGEIASGPMKTAQSFVYTYTITPTDPLGPATVTVSGSDLAGNPAVLSDPNAFEIIEPGSALPVSGGLGLGLLAGMMALGGAVLVRRRKP